MTDLGVVDPLRPPASVVAFGARLRLLPPYAIAFLGVFVIRAIADLSVAIQRAVELGPQSIFGLILGSMPDWLALLMPVAVGWAVVRFGDASPRVVRGAIAVALSEVVAMGATFVGGQDNPAFVISGFVRMISAFLLAGGLISMAHGLEALRSSEPTSGVRRAALLGVAIGVAVAAIELVARVAQIVNGGPQIGEPDLDRDLLIANAMGASRVLVILGWSYLAWVLMRADRDPGRPRWSTRLGAWAGWLAIGWLVASLVGLFWLPFASDVDAPSANLTMLSSILLVFAVAGATLALASITALVAGLARGLAAESDQPATAEPG